MVNPNEFEFPDEVAVQPRCQSDSRAIGFAREERGGFLQEMTNIVAFLGRVGEFFLDRPHDFLAGFFLSEARFVEAVQEEPVAGFCRYPSGGLMRLARQTQLIEIGYDAADAGGAEIDPLLAENCSGGNRSSSLYVAVYQSA